MSLEVSSWFVEQTLRQVGTPVRHFLMGGSDYADWVLRWPTLRAHAGTIDLGTSTIRLANHERTFQFLVDSDMALTTSCEIALGYVHPTSGEERISLYVGQPTNVAFADGGTTLRLQLQGKTRQLNDAVLGTDVASGGVDFTTSDYYPADLAWTLVTSYGGMSTVWSSANPDIHVPGWAAWRDDNAIRDVRVRGYFTGEKIYEVLDRLAFMDSRVIHFQDGRLRVQEGIAPYDAAPEAFPERLATDLELVLDPGQVLNRYQVEADLDLETSRFQVSYTRVHTASAATFSTKAGRYSGRGLWFADVFDPICLAEDQVLTHARPLPRVRLRAPLAAGPHRTVGDVVTLSNSQLGLSQRPMRIVELGLDLDDARLDFVLEAARYRPWRHLSTVSSRNVLVRSLAAVDSGVLVALEETAFNAQVLRQDSAGSFQPLDIFGSALLVLNGSEAILGGPPTSSATHGVLARSPDGCATAVAVYSLSPGIRDVHHIFQVRSGTLLASTTSGGILRSTDAGSSWAQTWTISGHHHINRFVSPRSGTLWGATGHSNPLVTDGLAIWQSGDEGQTWALHHTVTNTGEIHAHGLYRLSDTEMLLGTTGGPTKFAGVYRGTRQPSDAVSWSIVLSAASFTDMLTTTSGDLLFGFDVAFTGAGGGVYRSQDMGSSWILDTQATKRGNVRLVERGDGTTDAYISRAINGQRTDRYRREDIATPL